jgi:D-aminoacyl-tRNA deacylase
MRAVIQRVTSAAVDVGGERVASIGQGLLVLVGVAEGDEEKDGACRARSFFFFPPILSSTFSTHPPSTEKKNTAPALYIGSKILNTRLWPGPPPADPSAPPRPWAVALADDPAKSVLLVSQFTLLGSVRRGTKPDFGRAARPEPAAALFESLVDRVRVAVQDPGRVQTGVFGAMMQVGVRDGRGVRFFSFFPYTSLSHPHASSLSIKKIILKVSLVNDGPVTLTIDSRTVGPRKDN